MYPLHIEILMHYHCCADEFPRLDAPACREVVNEFLAEGILRVRTDDENKARTHWRTYEATERAETLVKALCAVPYPVQRWVMPAPYPTPEDGL